jgi:hypothetical protein
VLTSLRCGRLRAAQRDYVGPLLSDSDAPGIVEERVSIEVQLRAAVLSTRDPGFLRKWVESAWGREDAYVWDVLAGALPCTSNARAAAAAEAARLQGVLTP